MIHKLLKRPQAIIGLCLIAIVIVIAIAAPAFSPHDPELVNLSQKYAQPDAEYPLGTDQLGRCTLSRLLYGARYSIGISLPVLLILSVIGLIVLAPVLEKKQTISLLYSVMCLLLFLLLSLLLLS